MVMMTRLQLENYRCIARADLTLSPLTVLVGPNSSGKSSLLSALHPNSQGRFRIDDVRHRDLSLPWEVAQHLDTGNIGRYRREQQGWTANQHVGFEFQLAHLDIKSLRQGNHVQKALRLEGDGRNLTNVFATLTRAQHAAIAKQLGSLVPSFSDIGHEPSTQVGFQNLRFQDRWKPDVWYLPDEVSDGTMLVTAYLVLQHQDPPVDIIAIEEPERGLHPYLLGELVALWRKMSRGEVGQRPIQIVLATHSAELLDHVEASEVRFLSRDAKTGDVRIEMAPTGTEDWRNAYRTYQDSLGSMWLSGSLGGVPGA